MSDIIKTLQEHAFFYHLSEETVAYIASCGYEKVFRPEEMIGQEGTPANDFYIVQKGKIAIQIHAPHQGAITVHTVSQGDIVGWSWLFPPYEWCFDIKALEATSVIALDGKCLRNKCEEDHELGYALMKKFSHIMIQRLRETRMQVLDMYRKPNEH